MMSREQPANDKKERSLVGSRCAEETEKRQLEVSDDKEMEFEVPPETSSVLPMKMRRRGDEHEGGVGLGFVG